MEHKTQNNQKTLYESIFGGEGYSINGPIFYFTMGVFCTLIVIFLLVFEFYYSDIVANVQSIRPDIKFPFYGIILILSIPGAIIGIFFGLLGIIWCNLKE